MEAVQQFSDLGHRRNAQGRIMIVIGILLSIAAFLIFRSESPLL